MRTRHLLAVFFLLAGAARAQDFNVISSVEVKGDGSNVVVSVKGTRPPNFTTFSMADPPRFVIDLSESRFQGVAESMAIDDGVISVVKNLSYGTGATAIARVMVAFVADVEPPDVQTVGNDLVIRVARPGGAPPAVAAAPDTGQAAAEARARAEADARATAQVEAAALAASQQRAREEAEAARAADVQARADAQAKARVQAAAEAQAAAAQAQAEPPAGEKLGDEGVVVAPAETPAEPSAEEAKLAAAAAERQRAREEAAAAAQARADAEAARAAEVQGKADAKARAAEDARARKQAEADARAAAAAEKKAAADAAAAARVAAAAEKKAAAEAAAAARVAAAAEKKAAAEAARQAAQDAKREAAAAKAADRSAALAAAGPSAKLAEIGFKQLPGASRVYVRTSVTPRFTITDVGDDTVRVELENTRATRRNDTRFLDTSFFPSPVALITPSKKGTAYVVDIKLRQRVPYQQKVEGDLLAIDFERPQPAPAAAPAAEPAEAGTVIAPDEETVVAPADPATDAPPRQ